MTRKGWLLFLTCQSCLPFLLIVLLYFSFPLLVCSRLSLFVSKNFFLLMITREESRDLLLSSLLCDIFLELLQGQRGFWSQEDPLCHQQNDISVLVRWRHKMLLKKRRDSFWCYFFCFLFKVLFYYVFLSLHSFHCILMTLQSKTSKGTSKVKPERKWGKHLVMIRTYSMMRAWKELSKRSSISGCPSGSLYFISVIRWCERGFKMFVTKRRRRNLVDRRRHCSVSCVCHE